jgi:hypothetical protein
MVCLVYTNYQQKQALAKQEAELVRLWDDKIAAYQFTVNLNYRTEQRPDTFFNKLDTVYQKLRGLLQRDRLSAAAQQQIHDFLAQDFPENAGITHAEILDKLQVKQLEQAFVGDKLDIVKRIATLLDPIFMVKCKYMLDFDIWEKRNDWHLSPGDTTTIMIRLLKNYDIMSHQLELIPSTNLKVLQPYLGELSVIVPQNAQSGTPMKYSFKACDWTKKDTIEQVLSLPVN